MPPHPTWDGNAVTVAQGVNHRGDARQIVAATGEPVPPTMPIGGLAYHCHAVGVIGVRPLFTQFAEFYDTAAAVVVGHPTGNLVCRDSWNEHGRGPLRR